MRYSALFLCAALAAATPAAAEPASVERVVVTGTRAPVRALDQAGNTARIEAAEVARVRAEHPAEILNRLPGVLIHRNSGAEHLTAIRSPVLTGGAGAGSFLYLEDGVPLRAAGFANVNGLFEAHTEIAGAIEVVRGPGSALYGSNAVHGLINVIARTPSPAREWRAEASYGSFGRVQGRAWVSDSFGAHGLFAGLSLYHDGGFRADSSVDEQKLTVRWDWSAPATRISARLAATNLHQETAGFAQGDDAYDRGSLARGNPNPEAFRDARSLRASLRIERDLPGGWTIEATPYARWTDMAFLLHFLPYQGLEENGHWSIGTQLAARGSPAPRLEAIFGLDLEWSEGFLKETQERPSFGPFPQGVHYDYTVGALVAAPYAHLEWQVDARLRLTAGLRGEFTSYDYDTATPADTIGRFRRPADRRDDFLTLTPKLGANYALSEGLHLFAHLARGARAPQTTDLYRLQNLQTVGDIEAETIDSAELGLRGAGETWAFELAAYAMRKENFFFRDADGLNVPEGVTEHRGIELSGSWQALPDLAFAGGVSWAVHTYAFDRIVGNASETIRAGDRVDTAPEWMGSLRAIWTPTQALTAELEWVHMGRYFTNAANSETYPGHDVFNLRLDYELSAQVSLFGAIRNLTNTDYAERADFAFGNERYFPGEDRAFTIGIGLRN